MTSQENTTQGPGIESLFQLGSGRFNRLLERARLAHGTRLHSGRVAALSAAVQSTDSATLDRIKFDPAFVEQALGTIHPGTSLMITDLAADPETRSDKDFVIVTSEYVQS